MLRGTVKFFNKTKGFGFIVSDGKDYFFHAKALEIKGIEVPWGAPVSFDFRENKKGKYAYFVRIEKD